MSMQEHCRMMRDFNLDAAYEEESYSNESMAHMLTMSATRSIRARTHSMRNKERLSNWSWKRKSIRCDLSTVARIFTSKSCTIMEMVR